MELKRVVVFAVAIIIITVVVLYSTGNLPGVSNNTIPTSFGSNEVSAAMGTGFVQVNPILSNETAMGVVIQNFTYNSEKIIFIVTAMANDSYANVSFYQTARGFTYTGEHVNTDIPVFYSSGKDSGKTLSGDFIYGPVIKSGLTFNVVARYGRYLILIDSINLNLSQTQAERLLSDFIEGILSDQYDFGIYPASTVPPANTVIGLAPFNVLLQICNSTGVYVRLENGAVTTITLTSAVLDPESGIIGTGTTWFSSTSLDVGGSAMLGFIGASCSSLNARYRAGITIDYQETLSAGTQNFTTSGVVSGLAI